MMSAPLVPPAIGFARTYALLLLAFFGTALAIERLNRGRPERIQAGLEPSRAMVRRDRRRSVRSLANIALLLAIGQTLNSELGFGWQPGATSVPAVIAS